MNVTMSTSMLASSSHCRIAFEKAARWRRFMYVVEVNVKVDRESLEVLEHGARVGYPLAYLGRRASCPEAAACGAPVLVGLSREWHGVGGGGGGGMGDGSRAPQAGPWLCWLLRQSAGGHVVGQLHLRWTGGPPARPVLQLVPSVAAQADGCRG
jgi:hypothetical protein